jgi:hypothetical protein
MKKTIFLLVLVVLFIFICMPPDLLAQCPMCKLSAESNLENGGVEGKGLNKGILYIFVLPYLLVGTFAFIWWKNKKEHKTYDNPAQWN